MFTSTISRVKHRHFPLIPSIPHFRRPPFQEFPHLSLSSTVSQKIATRKKRALSTSLLSPSLSYPIQFITQRLPLRTSKSSPPLPSPHTTAQRFKSDHTPTDLGPDHRKWESNYKNDDPLSHPFVIERLKRPLKRSNVDPRLDPAYAARKRQVTDRLRLQLRDNITTHDALPRQRDDYNPLKPFIPQIPKMEDTPYQYAKPNPIWDTLRPTPTLKEFIFHYLPTRAKWRRTKELFNEYAKTPVDVLDPKYTTFYRNYLRPRNLVCYFAVIIAFSITFETYILSKTPLEELFEVAGKNMLRSESFLVTANTIQEMANQNLLSPSNRATIHDAKLFLSQALNMAYSYNSQATKDVAYLIDGFRRSIQLHYPDNENVLERHGVHIDHFSQHDIDLSYIHVSRYLSSFERFFDVYYTKNIEMTSLKTRVPYGDLILPRQAFLGRMLNAIVDMMTTITDTLNKYAHPFDQLHVHQHDMIVTVDPVVHFTDGRGKKPSQTTLYEIFHHGRYDAVDFSRFVTAQFNSEIAKIMDFYFDHIPMLFDFNTHHYHDVMNDLSMDLFYGNNDSALLESLASRHVQQGISPRGALDMYHDETKNPLLKRPNIGYQTDFKHRFFDLYTQDLPAHIHLFQFLSKIKKDPLERSDPDKLLESINTPTNSALCPNSNPLLLSTSTSTSLESPSESPDFLAPLQILPTTTTQILEYYQNASYKQLPQSLLSVTTSLFQFCATFYHYIAATVLPTVITALLDPLDRALSLTFMDNFNSETFNKNKENEGEQKNTSVSPLLGPLRVVLDDKDHLSFDTALFNFAYTHIGKDDYVHMLLRNIDMLHNIRYLFGELARRVSIDIDDFHPDQYHHTILPILQHAPYISPYYNQAIEDLSAMVDVNNDYPLIPTIYQFNELGAKSARVVRERIHDDALWRSRLFSHAQRHNTKHLLTHDLPHAQSFSQVWAVLSAISNNIAKQFTSPSSSLPPLQLALDRIHNRFDDDLDRTTHIQIQVGRAVTKLDMCLLLTYAELERQKAVFGAILPTALHASADLILSDERDLQQDLLF